MGFASQGLPYLFVERILNTMRVGGFGQDFHCHVPRGCVEYTKTNDACKTRPQGLDDCLAASALSSD